MDDVTGLTAEQHLRRIDEALEHVRARYDRRPEAGIVLGTGLGALANDIAIEEAIDYEEIPHFPVSTVESHSGRLIFGALEGRLHAADVDLRQVRPHCPHSSTTTRLRPAALAR